LKEIIIFLYTVYPSNGKLLNKKNKKKGRSKMSRVFNFSAGPATLPEWALEQAQKELLDFHGIGMSILEISHRSKDFSAVHEETKKDLRDLWQIPENFEILFLQGGASSQFFMAPMNIGGDATLDYVITGSWSKKALKEAKILNKKTNVAYTSEESNFKSVPKQSDLKLTAGAGYVHITTNNTIYGTQMRTMPETNGVPIVADMSSDILGYNIDFKNVGIIYAGAQKNLGPSGVTLVIIRKDLLERVPEGIPTMLKYTTHAEKDSMYNTPPVFPIYMIGLTAKWLKKEGGIKAMEERNEKKAGLIYDVIDNSNGYYKGHADKDSRSLMNVTFNLSSKELEAQFVKEATAAGLNGLKGHRSVGGIRASIYNAMPVEGCEKLAAFMKKFQADNQ
jgi:phosphoserine aminotransferase